MVAAVIEFRRPAIRVAGDALSGFKGAVIFQKICDAGGPKRVRRRMSRQSACLSRLLSMSAASVRTSGWRDNLPVFPIEAGNKGMPAKTLLYL